MHKKQTGQLDRGGFEGIEGFLCGCCSAHVSLKSPYADFQQLLLLCVVPLKESCFQTAACTVWDPTTDNPKQF